MKLKYQKAVIGFCQDLTSPNAKATPLAIAILGETPNYWLAGFAYRDVALRLDPISKEILADVPRLLHDYLNGALESLRPGDDLRAVLQRLHDSLRNSLSVLEIRDVEEIHVDSELPADLEQRGLMLLGTSVLEIAETEPVPAQPAAKKRTTRSRPVLSVWESPRAPQLAAGM